ncbi:MAG TPA: RNA-binding protein [Nitrospirota bacterium]|nr:RNA-binding protein [Nitrospirota bacterium]
MTTKVRVENLPSDITEDRLKDVFTQFGDVQAVTIKTHFLSGLPKGYGFVKMSLDVDAYRAVNILDGTTFKNRKIHLKEEKPLIEKAKQILTFLTKRDERVFGSKSRTH